MAPITNLNAKAILLDIEGTTAPISFVYQELFPYARLHGPSLIREQWMSPTLIQARHGFATEDPDLSDDPAAVITHYLSLMEQDRKSTSLKLVQGLVWQRGLETGELKSQFFDDVPAALTRWKATGRQIAIYSSGSVLAQQLLFKHSTNGDLTTMLDAYFDTGVGTKRQPQSYETIAGKLEKPPAEILFASDVLEELDAAQTAGLQTVLLLRPGNAPIQRHHEHRAIHSFNELK